MSLITKAKPDQWLEVRYNDKLYLVGVSTLLKLYERHVENVAPNRST